MKTRRLSQFWLVLFPGSVLALVGCGSESDGINGKNGANGADGAARG